ncbi:MAG: hypothetical protein IJA15_02490 [Clostridia bacterium]|nr:hypothetical protein [Clostridia bacterium]
MRAKKFFKKLNSELDGVLPAMSEKVKSAPIPPCESQSEIEENTKKPFNIFEFFTLKRVCAFASALVILMVGIMGSIALFGGAKVSDRAVVTIDINPSFELVLDEDMKVEKVTSTNTDGDMLLKSQGFADTLIGLELKEVTLIIANKATEYGFIDYRKDGTNGEYNQIKVNVSGNTEKLPKDLLSGVNQHLTQSFMQEGIFLFVDCVQTTVNDFNTLLQTAQEKAQYYGEGIKNAGAEMTAYCEELVLDYTTSLLLYTVEKYKLVSEITQINEQIKEDQSNILGLDYWTYFGDSEQIAGLKAEMSIKLEDLYQKFNIDARTSTSGVAFYLVSGALENFDLASAEEVLKTGVTVAFFESELMDNLILTSMDSIISTVIEFYSQIVMGMMENITQTVNEIISSTEEIRAQLFTHEKLDSISQEEYQAFLTSIGK